MIKTLILIGLTVGLGACATTKAPKTATVQDGIPRMIQPNQGTTASRKAGFGAAGDFAR